MTFEDLTENVEGWTVIEDYTGSDHQYIIFQINPRRQKRRPQSKDATPRWNTEKMDEDKLTVPANARSLTRRGQAEEVVEATMCLIHPIQKAAKKENSHLLVDRGDSGAQERVPTSAMQSTAGKEK